MNRREISRILALVAGAFVAGGTRALAADDLSPSGNAQNRKAQSGTDPVGVDDLLREPLAQMPQPEVTMLTLTISPGAISHAHRHTGPVFAYILEGSIQNQVEPEPPKIYRPGDFFYEPPMHVHRQLKNLSATKEARILIVQIGEKGKPFTISA